MERNMSIENEVHENDILSFVDYVLAFDTLKRYRQDTIILSRGKMFNDMCNMCDINNWNGR